MTVISPDRVVKEYLTTATDGKKPEPGFYLQAAAVRKQSTGRRGDYPWIPSVGLSNKRRK